MSLLCMCEPPDSSLLLCAFVCEYPYYIACAARMCMEYNWAVALFSAEYSGLECWSRSKTYQCLKLSPDDSSWAHEKASILNPWNDVFVQGYFKLISIRIIIEPLSSAASYFLHPSAFRPLPPISPSPVIQLSVNISTSFRLLFSFISSLLPPSQLPSLKKKKKNYPTLVSYLFPTHSSSLSLAVSGSQLWTCEGTVLSPPCGEHFYGAWGETSHMTRVRAYSAVLFSLRLWNKFREPRYPAIAQTPWLPWGLRKSKLISASLSSCMLGSKFLFFFLCGSLWRCFPPFVWPRAPPSYVTALCFNPPWLTRKQSNSHARSYYPRDALPTCASTTSDSAAHSNKPNPAHCSFHQMALQQACKWLKSHSKHLQTSSRIFHKAVWAWL